jgi:hypothetical protein
MFASIFRTALLAALALTLIACSNDPTPSAGDAPPDFELRIYPAPEQGSADMAGAVRRLLTGPAVEGTADQVFLGRVQALPSGDLAILASAPVHDDLERLFDAAQGERPVQVAADLQFWLIRADPADATSIPDRLAPLEDALADVAAQTGPVSFELIEHLRQRADVHDQLTTIRGSALYANTRQKRVGEDRLFVDLNLRAVDSGPSIQSNLTLEDGETVLLAQTGSPESDSLFIFVVRIDLL